MCFICWYSYLANKRGNFVKELKYEKHFTACWIRLHAEEFWHCGLYGYYERFHLSWAHIHSHFSRTEFLVKLESLCVQLILIWNFCRCLWQFDKVTLWVHTRMIFSIPQVPMYGCIEMKKKMRMKIMEWKRSILMLFEVFHYKCQKSNWQWFDVHYALCTYAITKLDTKCKLNTYE